jgi:hypothetical protein
MFKRTPWILAFAASVGGAQAETYGAPPADIGAKLDRLVRAYPEFIAGHDRSWLFLKDGRRFAISDGRTDKSFTALIEHPDIDDMFYRGYPAGADETPPAMNDDPGRARFQPLFDAMYGDCSRGDVRAKLRAVAWLPRHRGGYVYVTTVNGADQALAATIRELDELPDRFMPYLKPSFGGYDCRGVAGSTARSPHAWGVAIDINSTDYWRWSRRDISDPEWRNSVPIEIVRIFERHGFIWGGRWYHYDTMHFEYRPELLP